MDEKTKLEKTKRWFENQSLIVALAIGLIAFIAIAQFFKASKDIKESVDSFKSEEQETPVEKDVYRLEVSGKVVNSKELPVKGAKVEILEALGTISRTDNNGNFILSITSETPLDWAEIVISQNAYLPYTQKTKIEQRETIHLGIVELQEVPPKQSTSLPKPKIIRQAPSTENNVNFEGNTFNGPVINNPSGPINIDQTINTTPDTIKND